MSAVTGPERYEHLCDGCTCCSAAGCHRGPGSECPIGREGSAWEGEFMCPCTEPVSLSAVAADSFTCPVCGATSHNPHDVRWGYCGACHDWTGETPKPERHT